MIVQFGKTWWGAQWLKALNNFNFAVSIEYDHQPDEKAVPLAHHLSHTFKEMFVLRLLNLFKNQRDENFIKVITT